jgi:diacylglycerol kinase family enzyme
MTVALIVNPFSSSVTEPRLQAVEDALSAHARIETIQTSRRNHAVELAREAGRAHDAVLVFSGDGVFNEVLNGLDRPVPVGFIPGGRTNVLPRALGLPRDAVAAARRIGLALETGHTRKISLGRVNGRRFAFAAGLGFDAELIRRIEERGRAHDGRLPGDVVVAWLMTRQLASHRSGYVPALEIEGLGRAAFALVANGDPYSYAGPLALHLVPDACFELGLDVVAPVSIRARSLPFVMARSLLGRRAGRKRILSGHDLDVIDIRCDAPMPMHVDGEDLGDVTEAHFECEREAVEVLV